MKKIYITMIILMAEARRILLYAYCQRKMVVGAVVEKGRTMIPMRKIFEAFDLNVEWQQEEKKIVAGDKSTLIIMQVGKQEMFIDGKAVELDVAPMIIEGRTLVPVRAIAEALNKKVEWNPSTRSIYITN